MRTEISGVASREYPASSHRHGFINESYLTYKILTAFSSSAVSVSDLQPRAGCARKVGSPHSHLLHPILLLPPPHSADQAREHTCCHSDEMNQQLPQYTGMDMGVPQMAPGTVAPQNVGIESFTGVGGTGALGGGVGDTHMQALFNQPMNP